MPRLTVTKTYKLFVDGKFPRSESGRSRVVHDRGGEVLAHICDASRKDLRDAVTAARGALGKWRDASAYNRGQVLYRLAEMVEGKRAEFVEALTVAGDDPAPGKQTALGGAARRSPVRRSTARTSTTRPDRLSPADEVARTIDRLVHYAGWADKYAQLLGCSNAVAGPYHNFTIPEPIGVIAIVAPDGSSTSGAPPLLGLVSLLAPVLCPGNSCVVVTGETGAASLVGVILAEAIATSDVPAGVVNILTGRRDELVPVIASHRDIDGVLATRDPSQAAGGLSPEHEGVLRAGAAENLKRVTLRHTSFVETAGAQGLAWIEPLVELKTIWHPSAF